MIRYILLLSLLLTTGVASAQAHMDEVVYLKNGTSVRGLIIEWVPGTSISIRDKAGEMHTYTMAEVERIRRETGTKPPPPPFYAAIEAGITDFYTPHHNVYRTNIAYGSVTAIAGAHFSKVVSAGLGFGADIYQPKVYMLSAFAHMRVLFTKKKIAPYIELNGGYAGIVFYDEYSAYTRVITKSIHASGIMANPSIGVKFNVSKKVALTLSAGYKAVAFPGDNQRAHFFYSDSDNNLGNAFTVRAGVAF
ncbi:MAG: hypothetical protein JSS76_05870 [Bacteroidetes bacterium]|nr:hypothetical protein [Bacteroidota bacterium]MBS1684261.1 hypothetical protein [Bacteroidota bacterium]